MTSSFWLILLAVLAYGLVHSVLASLRFKAFVRQLFGPAADRLYRLGFNFIVMTMFLPILVLPVLLSDRIIYTIPIPWVTLTLAIQLMAIMLVFFSLRQTGILTFLDLRQAFFSEGNPPSHMVTDGFYRYVRHLLYTAGLVYIWLLPILTWNLLVILIGLTLYILIGIIFEERQLVSEFGEPYAVYRRTTPC